MDKPALETPMQYVTLCRGDHFYIFRYLPETESELVDALTECAENENLNFTWLDVLLIMRRLKL